MVSKRICNEDCFNCPYPDCINDELTTKTYRELNKIEKELLFPRSGEKEKAAERQRKYYEANRERMRERNRKRYWADVDKSRAYHRERYRIRKEEKANDRNRA